MYKKLCVILFALCQISFAHRCFNDTSCEIFNFYENFNSALKFHFVNTDKQFLARINNISQRCRQGLLNFKSAFINQKLTAIKGKSCACCPTIMNLYQKCIIEWKFKFKFKITK